MERQPTAIENRRERMTVVVIVNRQASHILHLLQDKNLHLDPEEKDQIQC